MHELYSWPFAKAVRAGVSSVMCAYSRINGSYACENPKTLNGILKEELGFPGYVMSDWGATMSGVQAIESGLDMTMPGALMGSGRTTWGFSLFGGNLTQAVENGTLSMSRVNDMVLRIMTPYFYLNQDDKHWRRSLIQVLRNWVISLTAWQTTPGQLAGKRIGTCVGTMQLSFGSLEQSH